MSGSTAFVGVTGLVVTGFLVLARLSQRVVDADDTDETAVHRPSHARGADRPVPSAPGPAGTRSTAASAPDGQDAPSDPRGEPPQPPLDPPAERPDGASARTGTAESMPVVGRSPEGASSRTTSGQRPARSGEPPERTPADRRAATVGETANSVDGIESMSAGALLANVALTQGLFGGLLAAAAWYFEVPGAALGLWGGLDGGLAVAVGAGFGFALWLGNEVASGVADAAGAAYDEQLRTLLAPGTVGGWVVLLGGTLPIIALVEEFLFRAAAIGGVAAAIPVSPWALAVVSSAAFALGHGAQGRVGILVTGALGFALAAGYVLTGSFLVVVVAHYVVNALEFGLHEGLGLSDPVWT